jgi:acetolactate synthase-1/2/3 large subunit
MDKAHPLCLGMIGMHGTVASNKAVQKADLLIALGARFSDRVTSRADRFAQHARVLQIDIDRAEVNKNIQTAFSVTGDLNEVLSALLPRLPAPADAAGPAPGWEDDIKKWKAETPHSHSPKRTNLHPRYIVEETAAALGPEAIAATDVGQHQMWAAQFWPYSKPRNFITSGGLGTMGFGLGAALGAKTANPECPVVLFTGAGCFRMNCAEMGTLANYRTPVLIVVFNNGVLGMVRQWQNLFYDKRFAETVLDRPPDFIKLAEAYGIRGWRACDKAAFDEALKAANAELAAGKSALIEAVIDKDEMVMPMVPGGKPLEEQIVG